MHNTKSMNNDSPKIPPTKPGKIVIEINKNTLLTLAVVTVLILLTYTAGKANGLKEQQAATIKPSPTVITTTSPIPTPTSTPVKTNYQKPVATPIPTPTPKPERKKVSYTTKEASFNGTYFCYEDRVNELSRQEQTIQVKDAYADSCMAGQQTAYSTCTNNQCIGMEGDAMPCINNCKATTLDTCLSKANDAGSEREKLTRLIREICP